MSRWDGQVSHAYVVETLVLVVILTYRNCPGGRNSLVQVRRVARVTISDDPYEYPQMPELP